jgi:hypothetical protein
LDQSSLIDDGRKSMASGSKVNRFGRPFGAG